MSESRFKQLLKIAVMIVTALAGITVQADQGPAESPARKKPLFLSGSWQFTRNVTPENFSRIPAGCKKFKLDPDFQIDLDTVAGKTGKVGDECIIYNEFELKQKEFLGFGAGADWWLEVYLNGERIFSTFPDGNMTHPCSSNDFLFGGNGRKGRNLLAVRVRRGEASWAFSLKGKDYVAASPSAPVTIIADPAKITGRIRPLNGVNNGPIKSSRGQSNMKLWQAAKIPYARNHDAAYSASYGGGHTVDVHRIFTDFSKDPNDPASYDFARTDRYLKTIMEGGSKVFYRLGSKIEHAPEKYGTRVPPDFKKWAVICEHIIRHYNEGWANGFKMNIEYWEIWNEYDLEPGSNGTSPTWQGTPEQFFEFYSVAATHLKKCFPKLKIGGPSIANPSNTEKFLTGITAGGRRPPLDFFSWHLYTSNPFAVSHYSLKIRKLLDRFGYRNSESILDECNYVRSWSGDGYLYGMRTIRSVKGAAFTAACMISGQATQVDKMMYYDARPCGWNGIFESMTFRPLKTYFVFERWGKLTELGNQIEIDTNEKNGIYAVGATDKGKVGILISRYFDSDPPPEDLPVTFTLKNRDLRGVRLYLIDETNDLTDIPYRMDKDGNLLFSMKANTIVYLEL